MLKPEWSDETDTFINIILIFDSHLLGWDEGGILWYMWHKSNTKCVHDLFSHLWAHFQLQGINNRRRYSDWTVSVLNEHKHQLIWQGSDRYFKVHIFIYDGDMTGVQKLSVTIVTPQLEILSSDWLRAGHMEGISFNCQEDNSSSL